MRAFLAVFLCLASAHAAAGSFFRDEDPDAPKWREEDSVLPSFPQEKDLLEFYVSAVASNRFYVDASTLEVTKDGVVRYTLVVKAAGGATNITREGIRCGTREYRLYASGRSDGTWAKTRVEDWRPIENKPVNRHHAALSKDLFCPDGVPVADAEDGRRALRQGGNHDAGGSSGGVR